MSSPDASPPCAEAAFRSLLAADSASLSSRWGATLGLHGILIARGRPAEAVELVDSSVAAGIMAAKGLYVVQAAAGLGADTQAASVIAELSGEYGAMGSARLWYHGIWLAHIKDRPSLTRVVAALNKLAAEGDPLSVSTARAISGRLALLDGDTVQAITLLAGAVPAGGIVPLEWGLQEPFGSERLLRARLLLARGDADAAMRVAAQLDHPRPVSYLMYVRQSLEVREKAAQLLGKTNLSTEYGDRLARLQ